jgi:cysteine desulfurase
MDLAGFAVSAGSACSSGKVRASHVLRAMGLPEEIAGCAIRVSLGHYNSEADINAFVAAYRDFAERAGTGAA